MTLAQIAKYQKGESTRQSILEVAVDIASEEGLEGLSIGRLAAELEMSKSGLFAHFGSKEELQLATIEQARGRFVNMMFVPAMAAKRGLPRLEALMESWLSYAKQEVFRGGCFFYAASAEFDGRPGPVRDRIAELMREWLEALEKSFAMAKEEKHLSPKADPKQLAFEINAVLMAANWSFQLFEDGSAFKRARTAIEDRIAAVRIKGNRHA